VSVGDVSEGQRKQGERKGKQTQRSLGSRVRGDDERMWLPLRVGVRVRPSRGIGTGLGSSSGAGNGRGPSFRATGEGGRGGRLEVESGRGGRLEIEGSEADVGMDDEEECNVGDTRGARYDASMSSSSSVFSPCSELTTRSVVLVPETRAVQSPMPPRLTPYLLVSWR